MLSMDFKVTTDAGTRRIAKAAFDFARANGKTNVAIVTKANIMKKTDGMFTRICHEVAADYPEITAEDWYIDIMTANLVNPEIRSRFQVFVLPNLYGDIITDEAAQIQGGVGTAGSANTGSQYAMFEAVHGTAPRLIADGEGDYANPASILKAAELLLRNFEALHVEGGALLVDGRVVAASAGTPQFSGSDTIVVHFEKGLTEYEGIYSAICHFFMKDCSSRYTYANREEDMGIPGLRKSKLSYYPELILTKYEALWQG